MPKVNKLTEKQKAFCREFIANSGDARKAYLTAYNSNSSSAAKLEGNKLLLRDDITEYIQTLSKPLENNAINKAISERERKKAVLWDLIDKGDDNIKCRALDILNKMDAEYININRNIEEKTDISSLDIETLTKLALTDDEMQ